MRKLKFLSAFLALLLAASAWAAILVPPGKRQFFDHNGAPLSNGQVYYYVPATSTFKNTWQDAAQTILNTNPITLDSSGYATVYGLGQYRELVKDQYGNTVWDALTDTGSGSGGGGGGGGGGVIWGGTSTGSGNAQILAAASGFTAANGQQVNFIAGLTNSGAMTLDAGTGPIAVNADSPTGPVALTPSQIVAGAYVLVGYDATANIFHLLTNSSDVEHVYTDTTMLGDGNAGTPIRVNPAVVPLMGNANSAPKLYCWGGFGDTGAILFGSGFTVTHPATGNYIVACPGLPDTNWVMQVNVSQNGVAAPSLGPIVWEARNGRSVSGGVGSANVITYSAAIQNYADTGVTFFIWR